MTTNRRSTRRIAFQGAPGAYSDLACRHIFPKMTPLACPGFEDVIAAVRRGAAELAMLPIENSVAGRVADIHHLLPESGLYIVGEHFERVKHQLLALPGASLKTIKIVRSHVHALSQCRRLIRKLGLKASVSADTAGAAAELAKSSDTHVAVIASELAGRIYKLKTLKRNVEDAGHNTTRFLIMARQSKKLPDNGRPVVTSFVFRVKNVPAALYKALGGFATNGINMTKLESYMVGGEFTATQFYADIEGHPDSRPVRLALEELDFVTRELKVLGTYPAHPFRLKAAKRSRGD